MSRVTERDLDFQLECLNSKTKKQYAFYKAYGVISLMVKTNHGGGDLIASGMSKRETYEFLCGVNNLLYQEKKGEK